ncbi:MAG: hypothetical protein ACO1SV_16990 [Fimbriimonas sp.]
MKGIPPEIDTLLWAVAEDESPRAGDEFVARYPKYAGELARRRQMVQGLKGGRPTTTTVPRARPAFRPAPERSAVPRRTLAMVGTLVLAAIAVASYTVATMAAPPAPDPKPIVSTQRPPDTSRPPERDSTPPANDPVFQDPPVQDPEPPIQDPGPATNSKADKPQTFRVKGADLEGALTMLGIEAGVKIVVAPGMTKRTIDADYDNVPLSEILSDLGRRFGFTPFDQGDGSIIVVPATDHSGTGIVPDENNRVPQARDGERTP